MPDPATLTQTIANTATIQLLRFPESSLFCTPIEERFERITRLARRALKVPVAAITFLSEDKQWFKSVAGWAVSELPNSQSFCPYTLAAGQLTVFADTHEDRQLAQHPLVTTGPRFRFYAGLPICDEHDKPTGTFCVFDVKPRRFSEEEFGTLRDLATLAQREIFSERMKSVHSQIVEKLGIARRESMMDPLTRLWNRRGANMMLKAAIDSSVEEHSSVAVAIVDLDRFKQVNDIHGHQVGDEVLRKTALRLIQNVRNNDSVCRIGGDEFLVVMKDTDLQTAKDTVERIQRQIESTPIATRQGDIRISATVGYAAQPHGEELSVDNLIESADSALIQSKAKRRGHLARND